MLAANARRRVRNRGCDVGIDVSRTRIIAVITTIGLMAAGISSDAGELRKPFLAGAAPAPRTSGPVEHVKAPSAMSRCLATWDRSSQMSKQEWKKTCRRVVKQNPGLYDKPF
jgi:hypothetical protein